MNEVEVLDELNISKQNKNLLLEHLKLLKENLTLLQTRRDELEKEIYLKKRRINCFK